MNIATIADVTSITMGQAPPGKECNKNGKGTIFVKAGEFGDRYPHAIEWTTKPQKLAKAGDTLVCVVGATAGKVNQAIECAIGRSAAAVRAVETRLDPNYLYRFFETKVADLRRISQGLAQGVLTREMLGSLEIPLPPLPEQRGIAAILDQADALRRLRRQSLSRLSDLRRSIFDLELSRNNVAPRPLGDFCHKITDGTHQSPKWASQGVPFIFVSNIRDQSVSLKTEKFVSEETYLQMTRNTSIDEGDVLYTCVGSYGHAALAPASKFLFQRHIAHLKPDPEKLVSEFLVELLECANVRMQADRFATGIAQKTVTLSTLKSIEVQVPSLERQHMMVERLRRIGELAEQSRLACQQFDALFASLQHRAFRGEL